MKKLLFKNLLFVVMLTLAGSVCAQSVKWIQSTEGEVMRERKIKTSSKAVQAPLFNVTATGDGAEFRAWGTTFNELNWDALSLLPEQGQKEILNNMFAPDGELRITRGRISMNANDYARSWYSCDEVSGDFQLKYFNIDRDREAIIPYIRAALDRNPAMRFWISPWSPPSWMKINHHYAVQSSRYNDLDPKLDVLLFQDGDRSNNEQVNPDKNLFPRRMTSQDYMIQDARYLQAYADYFCRFIDEYSGEGIKIDMVMYQNEAYSYTAYPGCAWTPEGAIRFNMEYLAPTLQKRHPEVSLYMGTFNTNRYDNVAQILGDSRMAHNVKGVGFQWEGRQILPRIRKENPQYSYVCSECECGWGSFDWAAAEHTFELINHYLGNGCSEFCNWNAVLSDQGESPWGWKQNALIRVDSKNRTYIYTPEYYAFMHYSHFVAPGSRIVGYLPEGDTRMPLLVARTPDNKSVVVVANFNNEERPLTLQLGKRYLNVTLSAHSFNTFVMN